MLQNEQDLSTKRNAFQFLANHAEERAVAYLLDQIDNAALWGDILQMAVLDLIRKVGPTHEHISATLTVSCGRRMYSNNVCLTSLSRW